MQFFVSLSIMLFTHALDLLNFLSTLIEFIFIVVFIILVRLKILKKIFKDFYIELKGVVRILNIFRSLKGIAKTDIMIALI